MINRQRRCLMLKMSKRTEWRFAAVVGAEVDIVQDARILLKLGIDFQHNVILVELREHGRYLTLTKRIIEGVVDSRSRDAQPRRRGPVNHKLNAETIVLLVGSDIAQRWHCPKLVEQLCGPDV